MGIQSRPEVTLYFRLGAAARRGQALCVFLPLSLRRSHMRSLFIERTRLSAIQRRAQALLGGPRLFRRPKVLGAFFTGLLQAGTVKTVKIGNFRSQIGSCVKARLLFSQYGSAGDDN